MNKSLAVEQFRAEVLPSVFEQYGQDDGPAVREAWNNFADDIARRYARAYNWAFPRELSRWA